METEAKKYEKYISKYVENNKTKENTTKTLHEL